MALNYDNIETFSWRKKVMLKMSISYHKCWSRTKMATNSCKVKWCNGRPKTLKNKSSDTTFYNSENIELICLRTHSIHLPNIKFSGENQDQTGQWVQFDLNTKYYHI